MNDKDFANEKEHLDSVIKKIDLAKQNISYDLETLGEQNLQRLKELREEGASSYGFGVNDFDNLLDQLHQKNSSFNIKGKYKSLEEYSFLLKEPYFSRVDLIDPSSGEKSKYYIGKFSYTEDIPVVTDWRSKVASVYYRYRYPQKGVSYETPSGVEIKDLDLKRTFEIQDGELVKYYNNDLQLDESSIISEKIGERTGGVLEDIIQTLQESQLDIIEADPRQVCIVQGCVGSGKSTVAIHKLAHIFFNYPKIIRPDRCLMITKSQILAGYLSTLFPKLGIFDVTYKTVGDLVYNLFYREELGIPIDLNTRSVDVIYEQSKINGVKNRIIRSQKLYEKKIDDIFKDPKLEGFASFKYSYDETPYENILGIVEDATEELSFQKSHLKKNPDGSGAPLYKENISNLRTILRKTNKLKNDILNSEIKKVAKDLGVSMSANLGYLDALIYLYVYLELVGVRNFRKFEYCMVDEAQDFSPLEYLVLNKIVLRGRFSLFGDLNQTLEDSGIKDWSYIPDLITDASTANTFELTENYRSTKQIIKYANKILEPFTSKYLPKSIDRVGPEVHEEVFDNSNLLIESFIKDFSKDVKKIDKSIGVIVFSSDKLKHEEVRKKLQEVPIENGNSEITLLNPSKKISYTSRGVYLMDSKDCKGLEFSKVYVLGLNVNEINDFSEAREAFVAVTRAMNELHVYGIR